MKNTKRDHERCVRTSISMPPALFDRAVDRTRSRGYSTFSDYIQHLLREEDIREGVVKSG